MLGLGAFGLASLKCKAMDTGASEVNTGKHALHDQPDANPRNPAPECELNRTPSSRALQENETQSTPSP